MASAFRDFRHLRGRSTTKRYKQKPRHKRMKICFVTQFVMARDSDFLPAILGLDDVNIRKRTMPAS